MWAVVGKFGLEPGLRALWASLLGVRRADRDVQGGVRVAKGGGEDVGGPEISAKDEAWNLGLSGVITRQGSSVNKCGDYVVSAGGLAQGRWRGLQGSGLAGSAGLGFSTTRTAEP